MRSVLAATCIRWCSQLLLRVHRLHCHPGPTHLAAALAAQVLQLVRLSLLLHYAHKPCLHGCSIIRLPALLTQPLVCLQVIIISAA